MSGAGQDVDGQIRLAEKNCRRRTSAVILSILLGIVFGLLAFWAFNIQLSAAGIIAIVFGIIGFGIYEVTLKERAKCPACGGSWELASMDAFFGPISRFYFDECPYCKKKIESSNSGNSGSAPYDPRKIFR